MSQPTPGMSSLFKLEYPQSVGVYGSYDEAQQVVDFLADAKFPVENLCIVGTELKSIERVLGRRSWGTVMGAGVQTGLSTGLMITLVLWIFMPTANFLLLVLSALAIGIFVGVVMATLGYWMSQGKRDFRSVSQTVATKYEVLVEHKVAGRARELISGMPGSRAAQFNPAQPPASPGYGQQAPGYGQQYSPGYPPSGYPASGYPGSGYPGSGYPASGYPASGYSYPPEEYPAVPPARWPDQPKADHPGPEQTDRPEPEQPADRPEPEQSADRPEPEQPADRPESHR